MTPPKDNAGLMPCREAFEREFPFAVAYREGGGYEDVRIQGYLLKSVWKGWQAAWNTRAPSESVKPDAGRVDVEALKRKVAIAADEKYGGSELLQGPRSVNNPSALLFMGINLTIDYLAAQGHIAQTAPQSGDDAKADDRYDEGFDDGHVQGLEEGREQASEFHKDLWRYVYQWLEKRQLVERGEEYTAHDVVDILEMHEKEILRAIKPDLSALIAEVMESPIVNLNNWPSEKWEYFRGVNAGTQDFAEKLTAVLKDKGLV